MSYFKKFTFLFLGLLAYSQCYAIADIKVSVPPGWKLVKNLKNSQGLTRMYIPASSASLKDQVLRISFSKGEITTPESVIKTSQKTRTAISCNKKSIQVIKKEKNMVLYKGPLSDCANGMNIWEMVKSFSMPDGHYYVMYMANKNTVSAKDIEKMNEVVRSAVLQ